VTLILTAMTPNTLVQVSDMRLTDTWTWKVVDETTTKAIVYEGRAMWAFAGPACMGNQPTAVWLASLLADNGPDGIVDAIGRSADSILRRYPEHARRFAVVAAGWEGSPGTLSPRYRQIANFDFVSGELWPGMRAFEERLDPRRDKAKVFAAGIALPPSLRAEIEGYVRRRAGRRNENAGDVVAILAAAFSTLAVQHPRVGRRALVGSIPRDWLRNWRDRPPTGSWIRLGGDDTVPGLWISRETEPDWAGPAFVDSGAPPDPGVRYMPAYAAPGVSIVTGFTAVGGATPSLGAYNPCSGLPRRPG
jgi:hypothetical protein